MSTDFMSLHKAGIGNAASYQVAGKPFVTGNLAVPLSSGTPLRIDFPTVTRKIIVVNQGNDDIRVGFSENGVKGTNFVLLNKKDGSTHGTIELGVKVTSVFLLSAANATTASLAAELTGIDMLELRNNWSGSAGVG
jgi:hypothetical protein